MHASPLVSVIVPAWNAEATIAETLQSVADQTYRNLEIIVVDDGSVDRTAEIAREFSASEPRARLIVKENGGVASARNSAITESSGEWIAPIDADDLWHPTRVEKMVAAALAAPVMPGFVYCWSRDLDNESRVSGSSPRWSVEGPAVRQVAYMNVVGNGSGLLARKEAILQARGYDEGLRARKAQGCEDMMIQLRIAQHYPVSLVREHLIGWRQHQTNMSGDVEQMDRSCRLVYRQLAQDRPDIPRWALRGMLALSAFELAQHYAVRGRSVRSLAWLARALRLDFLRCSLIVVYRFVRSVRRRIGPKRLPPRPRHFLEVDPHATIEGDPYRLDAFQALVRRIDLRRLERLAALDRMDLSHRQGAGELAGRPVPDLQPRQRERA